MKKKMTWQRRLKYKYKWEVLNKVLSCPWIVSSMYFLLMIPCSPLFHSRSPHTLPHLPPTRFLPMKRTGLYMVHICQSMAVYQRGGFNVHKEQLQAQSAEAVLVILCMLTNSTLCFNVAVIPLRTETAKIRHILVPTFYIILSLYTTTAILTNNKSLFTIFLNYWTYGTVSTLHEHCPELWDILPYSGCVDIASLVFYGSHATLLRRSRTTLCEEMSHDPVVRMTIFKIF